MSLSSYLGEKVRGVSHAVTSARKELDEFLRPPAPPTSEEAALAKFVKERFTYAASAKDCMTRTWATCLAFYVGEHWREWEPQARRLVENTKIPSWRVRSKHNQIPGFVSRAASKLIRSREIPRALAQTGDEDDEAAAEGGTRVLAHWWRRSGMELVEHEANIGRYLFGCSFLHDYWDPTKKAAVPKPDFGQMTPDPETGIPQPKLKAVEAAVGDVCPECLTVFDVFPEPCERWEDKTWCIVARRKPLAWFQETFNATVKADNAGEHDLLSSLIPGAMESGGTVGQTPLGQGQATLLVYYEKRSKKYPKGRTVMVCGERVLFSQDKLPMPHGEIPLTMMRYLHVPKRMWPMGVVELIIDPQRELNRGESNLAQVFRLYATPKRWINRRWNIPEKALINRPDEIVEGDFQNENPTQWVEQPPNLPAWVAQRSDSMRAAMQELAGQHDVSEGNVPTGVTAASAIQLLQGADNEHLAMPAYMGKVALEEFGGRVLSDIATLYREERLIGTFGRDKAQELMVLRGSDIGERDVVVDLTNGVEDSDQVRAEQALSWMPLVSTLPMEFQLPVLKGMGWNWLAEALQEGYPAVQQQQAQAQQAEQAALEQQAAQEQEGAAQTQALEAQNAEQSAQISAAQAEQQAAIQAANAEQQISLKEEQTAQAAQQAESSHQQQLRHSDEAHQADMAQKAMQMQLQAMQAAQQAATQKAADKAKAKKPVAGARK